jgi:hypothetical protein
MNASAEKVSPNMIPNAQHSIIKLLPNLTLSRDHVVTISSNDGAYAQNGWFAQSGSWEHISMRLVGSPTNVVITLRGPANTDYLLYVLYRNVWYYSDKTGSNERVQIWMNPGNYDIVIFSFPWAGGSGWYRLRVTP